MHVSSEGCTKLTASATHQSQGWLNYWLLCLLLVTTSHTLPLSRHSNGSVEYVEVKSSAQEQRHIFYISLRELESAVKYKENFTVVRVYGCPDTSYWPAVGTAAATTSEAPALVAGRLLERSAKQAQKGRKGAHVVDDRLGHTRLLFLKHPIELLKRQVVRLAMEV